MNALTFWITTPKVFIMSHSFQHSHIPKHIRNRTIPKKGLNILSYGKNYCLLGTLTTEWDGWNIRCIYTWPVTLYFMASFPVYIIVQLFASVIYQIARTCKCHRLDSPQEAIVQLACTMVSLLISSTCLFKSQSLRKRGVSCVASSAGWVACQYLVLACNPKTIRILHVRIVGLHANTKYCVCRMKSCSSNQIAVFCLCHKWPMDSGTRTPTLSKPLGYSALKPEQLEVTMAFIGGREVFAVVSHNWVREKPLLWPHACQ